MQQIDRRQQKVWDKIRYIFENVIDDIERLDDGFLSVRIPEWIKKYYNLTVFDIRLIYRIYQMIYNEQYSEVTRLHLYGRGWPYFPNSIAIKLDKAFDALDD